MINFSEIRSLLLREPLISIRLLCLVMLSAVGCRSEIDHKIDSLTASGITVKRDSTGAVFWIDTAGSSLDEHFWESLSSFEHLEYLSMTGSPVADADLPQLIDLTSLKSLDLSYTQVTTAGLSVLSRMDELQTLSLNGVRLDEKAVAALSRFTRIQSLSLIDTGLEADDCQKIQEGLSGCLVVW